MSHHYAGPNSGFVGGDARLDLSDLYAFPNPGDPGRSILILNVHSSIGENPRGPTTAEPFAPEALYEFKIDTDGDYVADIAYRVRFFSTDGRAQMATLRCVEGAEAARAGDGGQTIVEAASVSMGREAYITEAGDYRFFAGWRSDPFFFDRRGVIDNFQFTGNDFFIDKDVCSIVLEVPTAALGSQQVRMWSRVLLPAEGAGREWSQVNRCARPAQANFLTGDHLDAYLAAEPADDDRFVPVFAHSLEHTGGYSPSEASRVARTLLPDVLPFDPTRPASFPSNGRALTDDAADVFFATITNGKVTGDGIRPHGDLLAEFPYVGTPHNDHTQW
jgi:Domain of unknown function (DUF4331)